MTVIVGAFCLFMAAYKGDIYYIYVAATLAVIDSVFYMLNSKKDQDKMKNILQEKKSEEYNE